MIAATLLTVAMANAVGADLPLLPDAAAYAEDATQRLLAGETLPPDYRLQLMAMSPDARLQTLIFLRRAGLLTADAWPLADILGPATPATEMTP